MRFRLSEYPYPEDEFTGPSEWRVRGEDGEVAAGPFRTQDEAHHARQYTLPATRPGRFTVEGSGEPRALALGAVRAGGHWEIDLPDLAALIALAEATGRIVVSGPAGDPRAEIFNGYY